MPSITNTNLTLVKENNLVRLTLTYTATFNKLERNLGGLGLRFWEEVIVQGVDGLNGNNIFSIGGYQFPVTAGDVSQPINRNLVQLVQRTTLNEDSEPGDSDEIRCQIRITPDPLPGQTRMSLSEQEVLTD